LQCKEDWPFSNNGQSF